MRRLPILLLTLFVAIVPAAASPQSPGLQSADSVDIADKARLAYLSAMERKNSPGTLAADFPMTLRDGSQTTLRGLPAVDGKRLIIFYDPDCDHCVDLIRSVASDSAVTAAVASGALAVAAIYTEGDSEVFARSASLIPPTWLDAMTPGNPIEEDELYYLPEIPTMYLLDGRGVVLVRDMTLDELILSISEF